MEIIGIERWDSFVEFLDDIKDEYYYKQVRDKLEEWVKRWINHELEETNLVFLTIPPQPIHGGGGSPFFACVLSISLLL